MRQGQYDEMAPAKQLRCRQTRGNQVAFDREMMGGEQREGVIADLQEKSIAGNAEGPGKKFRRNGFEGGKTCTLPKVQRIRCRCRSPAKKK
jgi:hypothetical protein